MTGNWFISNSANKLECFRDMSLRQRNVIQKSCSICTPALIVRLEFKLPLNGDVMGVIQPSDQGDTPPSPSLTRFIH